MGDFFEDLGKKITETAGVVTKKTEEMMETQKIKSQIRLEERNKENALQELGKQVYDRYQNGEIVDSQGKAKEFGLCPKCGKKVEEEICFEEEMEGEPDFKEEAAEEKDTEMQVVEEAEIVEEDE